MSGTSQVEWTKLLEAAELLTQIAHAMGAARTHSTLTVGELLDEFQTAKDRAGRTERYLRQMRVSVRGVLGACLAQPIATVTTKEIEAGLAGLALAPRTVRGYFLDVRTLFSFAVRREYLRRSPAAAMDPPAFAAKPPALHSAAEVREILLAARAMHPRFCRLLAIRYFAGLRSAEADRLSEAEIKGDYIEVTAAKSKTRRRRLVAILPNLRAWLALEGRLPAGYTSGLAKRVAARAGVPWPGNVTRHSFCSYHLAHFGNAGRTALEAGHTEPMLFAHYREVVTKEAAAEFWAIQP